MFAHRHIHINTFIKAPLFAGNGIEQLINLKEVLYEVRCLKSTEDMILALAGQFKQLSHEPEKLINLSVNQESITQAISQLVNQLTNQSERRSINELTNQSINQLKSKL